MNDLRANASDILEDFLEQLERKEKEQDMHFSLYFIPQPYQPEEESSLYD